MQPIHKQFVSITIYDYGFTEIYCDVLQGSVVCPVLFLLYINDFNQAITVCKVHHFANNTDV